MINARQNLIEQQNQICLKLIEEIHRVRLVVGKITSTDMQSLLRVVRDAAEDEASNNILISTSHLLQTVSDTSMVDQIMALESEDDQSFVYSDLMVSFKLF